VGRELVYLLRRERDLEYKIGRTTNLKQRISMLSTGNGRELKIIHKIYTERSEELESYLKALYRPLRLRGEWYLLGDSAVEWIKSIKQWPIEGIAMLPTERSFVTNRVTKRQKTQQFEICLDFHSEKPLYSSSKALSARSNEALQGLLRRYGIEQPGFTRILDAYKPPISRSYGHYVWQGQKPPSAKVILAIHEAHPEIPASELLQLAEDTRRQT
jgi:hypothetical protein